MRILGGGIAAQFSGRAQIRAMLHRPAIQSPPANDDGGSSDQAAATDGGSGPPSQHRPNGSVPPSPGGAHAPVPGLAVDVEKALDAAGADLLTSRPGSGLPSPARGGVGASDGGTAASESDSSSELDSEAPVAEGAGTGDSDGLGGSGEEFSGAAPMRTRTASVGSSSLSRTARADDGEGSPASGVEPGGARPVGTRTPPVRGAGLQGGSAGSGRWGFRRVARPASGGSGPARVASAHRKVGLESCPA